MKSTRSKTVFMAAATAVLTLVLVACGGSNDTTTSPSAAADSYRIGAVLSLTGTYAGLGEAAGIFKTTNGGELWGNINTGITLNCPAYLLPTGGAKQGMTLDQDVER